MSNIALRLLEKRPEERYASAEGLLQALWEAAKERGAQRGPAPARAPQSAPVRDWP